MKRETWSRENPFTDEERRIGGRNANIAARRNKDLAAIALAVSNTRIQDEKLKKKLAGFGIPEKDMTYSTLIAAEVFQRAVRGSPAAMRKFEEWLDRSKKEQVR